MKNRSYMAAVVLVSATVLSGLPRQVIADEAVTSGASQWIRVTTSGDLPGIAKLGARLEGTLQQLDENRLVLERGPNREAVTVPRAAIARVDIRERGSSRGKWAAIGAAAGLAVAVAAGVASPAGGQNCIGACVSGAVIGILTVPVGALLGLAIGHGSQWKEDVPVDHLRLSVGPAPGRGIAIAVTRAF